MSSSNFIESAFGDHKYRCETVQQAFSIKPLQIKYITSAYVGPPAARLGIAAGDVLIRVNGRSPMEFDEKKPPRSAMG